MVGEALQFIHRRRLARTLRTWRKQAGYSVERAASELLCGMGTISRMETATSVEPLRVKAALELYGAPAELVTTMTETAVQYRRTPTSTRTSKYDFLSSATDFALYLDLEDEASEIVGLYSQALPLILQHDDYSAAYLAKHRSYIHAGADLFELFAHRRTLLLGTSPPRLRGILPEAALHIEVGGPTTQLAQLDFLIELAESAPNVELRVLPFTAGPFAGMSSNYVGLGFAGAPTSGPEIAFGMSLFSQQMYDEDETIGLFNRIIDQASALALTVEDSLTLMRGLRTRFAERARSARR